MDFVSINDLEEGMIPARTIYSPNGTILIAKGIILKHSYIERLKKFRVTGIYISPAEQPNPLTANPVAKAARNLTKQLLDDQALLAAYRLEDNAFKIEQIIYSTLIKPEVQRSLAPIAASEEIYRHSLRTALLAVHMGIAAGYDYLNLEYIAMCALLHDAGLGREPAVTGGVKARLARDNATNAHAVAGFILLRNNPDLDMIVPLVCLQHHEYYNGGGAPLGLAKTQITEFASLITVADFYDRLLYSMNNTRRQAIFKIIDRRGTQFSPEMVKLFEKAVIKTEIEK